MLRFTRRWLPLLVLGLIMVWAVPVLGCPNCKNSLPDSDDVGMITRLRDGYSWSYVGMSSMPFLAVGIIGYQLFKRIQQAEALENAEVKSK